jgi:SAM-dependent methyltransferase
MGDVWAVFSELDGVTQERLAGVLETRGADAQQQAMRHAFLGEIDFPSDARVLEVGCGTGVLTRQLAGLPDVSAVVGVDLSPFLLARARKLAAELPNVSFASGYMAVFDGDYATATVALGDHDPVQACVEAMMAITVNDRWLVRRLPALARASGFSVASFRSYGFADRGQ